MISKSIFEKIEQNIESVINRDTPLGNELWNELLKEHPADLAQFFSDIDRESFKGLFRRLPFALKYETFEHLSDAMRVMGIGCLKDQEVRSILTSLPADELTDLFEQLDDAEVKRYFALLDKKEREQVLSLMKFSPDSAGGIMNIEVVSLRDDFTVEQSIALLRRLQPDQELHQQIYVTNKKNQLVGHIQLEDLVLKHPKTQLTELLRPNELTADVGEDQEAIAQRMLHYHLMSVPVIGEQDYFLGVITSDTLVDIIEEEASEDVYKISAMTPIKETYFETSFFKLFWQRGYILVLLLLVESFSSTIMHAYEATLGFLYIFTTMLVSVGGNTSSQTSALTIQGITSGEINYSNTKRFLKREFLMSLGLGAILALTTFVRVYLTAQSTLLHCVATSLSLGIIVVMSVTLGSLLPLVLKRLNIDPAFSAGPVLATVIDILGIFVFCYISRLLLS